MAPRKGKIKTAKKAKQTTGKGLKAKKTTKPVTHKAAKKTIKNAVSKNATKATARKTTEKAASMKRARPTTKARPRTKQPVKIDSGQQCQGKDIISVEDHEQSQLLKRVCDESMYEPIVLDSDEEDSGCVIVPNKVETRVKRIQTLRTPTANKKTQTEEEQTAVVKVEAHQDDEGKNGYNEVPYYWTPIPEKQTLSLVDLGVIEDNQCSFALLYIYEKFNRNMPEAKILNVTRVQNKRLWQFYQLKRRQMEDSNPDVNERFLYHGTSKSVIPSICENNFDWRLCGLHGTSYGQGSYFSVNASYSHKFCDRSYPDEKQSAMIQRLAGKVDRGKHVYTMFFARVLCGRVTHGYKHYKTPPPLNPLFQNGPFFDSCADMASSPWMYVIFDKCQCYPEFIIEYYTEKSYTA